jgi:hypothetical protein
MVFLLYYTWYFSSIVIVVSELFADVIQFFSLKQNVIKLWAIQLLSIFYIKVIKRGDEDSKEEEDSINLSRRYKIYTNPPPVPNWQWKRRRKKLKPWLWWNLSLMNIFSTHSQPWDILNYLQISYIIKTCWNFFFFCLIHFTSVLLLFFFSFPFNLTLCIAARIV